MNNPKPTLRGLLPQPPTYKPSDFVFAFYISEVGKYPAIDIKNMTVDEIACL
jgi:hypothetical protein